MAANGGPNLAEDGLVFYYDTDNGKSYKGEPTVNIIGEGAPRATGVWGTVGNRNFAGIVVEVTGNNFYSAERPHVVKLVCTNVGSSGYKEFAQQSLGNTAGTTYTYSFDYKFIIPNNASGGAIDNTIVYGAEYKVPDSSGKATNIVISDIPLKDGWTRRVYTYEATYTGPNYYRTNIQANGYLFEVLLDNFQVQESDHVTPFTTGTRSATESLYDFIGDGAIDVSNVSFDSNADITFDGTNDYVELDESIAGLSNIGTIEAVIKPTEDEPMGIVGWGDRGTSNWGGFDIGNRTSGFTDEVLAFINLTSDNNNKLIMFARDSVGGTYQLNDGNYHHVVAVVDGVENTFYLDGVKMSIINFTNGNATTEGFMRMPALTDLRVGNSTYNNGHIPFTGEIPIVKIYNRALTAEEVQNNFNGIRSRFGI